MLQKGACEALRASRCAHSEQAAHQKPEVLAGHVDQQSLQYLVVAPQVDSPHVARFVAMGETAFDQLAALA